MYTCTISIKLYIPPVHFVDISGGAVFVESLRKSVIAHYLSRYRAVVGVVVVFHVFQRSWSKVKICEREEKYLV